MTNSRIYAIPLLGRYGLAHGMLAWARCQVWCEQNGATMLAPFWLKLRLGPYLRRERDKRNYFLLFQAGSAIGGLHRIIVLAKSKKIDVGASWPPAPPTGNKSVVLRFQNDPSQNELKFFGQIVGYAPLLRRKLMEITKPRFRPVIPSAPFIAIHVRMGDFTPLSIDDQVTPDVTNTRLPVDWYGDRLDALRHGLNTKMRAIVFSDGSDTDLAPLLKRVDVARAPKQQSVTDLLQMGLGVAVIASGSGFSRLGAFLGSAPRIAHPGQAMVPIDADPTRDIESPFGADLPSSFVEHVRARSTR
jgi:hypothetical protein